MVQNALAQRIPMRHADVSSLSLARQYLGNHNSKPHILEVYATFNVVYIIFQYCYGKFRRQGGDGGSPSALSFAAVLGHSSFLILIRARRTRNRRRRC
jgi:hypothetical protein